MDGGGLPISRTPRNPNDLSASITMGGGLRNSEANAMLEEPLGEITEAQKKIIKVFFQFMEVPGKKNIVAAKDLGLLLRLCNKFITEKEVAKYTTEAIELTGADKQVDGPVISLDAFFTIFRKRSIKSIPTIEEIKEAFQYFDKSDDEFYIDAREFRNNLIKYGDQDLTTEEIEALVKEAEKDGLFQYLDFLSKQKELLKDPFAPPEKKKKK